MTSVNAQVRRPLGFDSFADIPGLADVRVISINRDGITFDGDLTPEQADAVWWRVTSTDDADETCRRNIKALRDAEADTASPLLLALADAFLGV